MSDILGKDFYILKEKIRMNIREEAHKMKLVAPFFAGTSVEVRNTALAEIAKGLKEKKEDIFRENLLDREAAKEAQISDSVLKRLKFDEGKLADVINGIEQLISLPDPLNKTSLERELDEGLRLVRKTCPIGVIGVIFEARPDALVQIASLCIKSGNCAILKGGKETARTNRILFSIIVECITKAGLPKECLLQAEQHNEIDELLSCDKDVDLLIPRGSNAFVQYIMNHTKIPVLGHADGICHTYVDKACDQNLAVRVLVDAKTQYTAACNATETILIHREILSSFLPVLAKTLIENGVKICGTREVEEILKKAEVCELMQVMEEDAFAKEYLDLICSVKAVDTVEEAVAHINRFGSHHTDCILTQDADTAEYFMQMVDSAGVYLNCSTRFADGFRYGFGAEVGISTSKIHARGPVGLEGLVTYKYRLYGQGQIVGDYASGKSSFHFKELI